MVEGLNQDPPQQNDLPASVRLSSISSVVYTKLTEAGGLELLPPG